MNAKRIATILAALAMLMGTAGISAYANEEAIDTTKEAAVIELLEENNNTTASVAKVGGTEYATIDEAVANWTHNTTLTLLADVTLSKTIELNSNELYTLDLGTYTMTAAKYKTAISIVNKGRSKTGATLNVYADKNNPGGITATGATCILTTGKSGVQDRPIITIYGGVFNGSSVIKHSGSNGTNCPQFVIYDGTFNGSISTNRALIQIYGGTFNKAFSISPDSSAYTRIEGGRFVNLQNNYGSNLAQSVKWVFATKKESSFDAMNYDVNIYVDDQGYYVVTKESIDDIDFEACVAVDYDSLSGTDRNVTFKYSKLNVDKKLYYTDIYTAFSANNNKGEFTIFETYNEDIKTTGNLSIDMTAENVKYNGDITFGAKNHTFTVVFDSDKPYSGEVTAYPGCALGITETMGAVVTRTYYNADAYAKISDNDEETEDVYYATFEEAISNVKNGETIILLKDIELSKSLSFAKDIEFTIDGNGKKITPAAGSTETNSAFNFGLGSDDTIEDRVYTIKNVTFEGWTTEHVLRLQGVDATVENCTFINCNQQGTSGLLTLTFCDAEVKNCTFEDNNCSKAIDVNYNSNAGTAADNEFVIDGCTFENNTFNFIGGIYYNRGKSFTLTNSKFNGNHVEFSPNGATVYCGYAKDVTISDCLFEDNTINTTSETEARVSPTIFVGNESVITNNVFVGNTGTRNNEASDIPQVVVSTYYSDIDLSANYWGGNAPVNGVDFKQLHKNDVSELIIDTYYAQTDNNDKVDLDSEKTIVAEANGLFYITLQDAVNAVAGENATEAVINLRPLTITEGTVALPATLTNVTIKGNNTVIKDTTIKSADGNSVKYDTITFEGIEFENSNIVLTGWRTGEVVYKNFTFSNNVFKNIVRTNNEAAIHFNCSETEAVENISFINNAFDGISGASNSGIYLQATGKVNVKNNLFKNIAFRPFVAQITTDDGIADTFTITGNTFRDSSVGRLQGLGNVATGTDTVEINISENAILDTTDAQAICFWNFNSEKTSVDFGRNYYGDIDPTADFDKFYYNGSTSSYEDIIAMGVLPYYTEASFDENGKYTELAALKNGTTDGITVKFVEVTPEVEGEKTYNINLVANSEIINRLNSGDLTFEIAVTDGDVAYEIIDIANDNITVSPVDNSSARYEFHFDTKTNVGNDTSKTITIAQVKFTGYGEFSFGITENDTNAVHTTTTDDNIVDTYLPEGKTESDGTAAEGVLNLGAGIPATYIYVPTRDLYINIDFPNSVNDNTYTYQQMKVVISGGDLEKAITIDLGNDSVMPDIATSTKPEALAAISAGSRYNVVLTDALTVNTTYNVEVSGEGYRTARYSVTMNCEDYKTLNFWNNVKDNAIEVEVGKESSEKDVTFLAGDIVKDSVINIYDLSAVVSYFGEIDLAKNGNTKYAKYDLNRDGKIDSKDVAYVLVSWGK